MKETWKTINDVIGRGQRRALSKQLKNQSGEMITDSKCIADEFNDFFVNVSLMLDQTLLQKSTVLVRVFMII